MAEAARRKSGINMAEYNRRKTIIIISLAIITETIVLTWPVWAAIHYVALWKFMTDLANVFLLRFVIWSIFVFFIILGQPAVILCSILFILKRFGFAVEIIPSDKLTAKERIGAMKENIRIAFNKLAMREKIKFIYFVQLIALAWCHLLFFVVWLGVYDDWRCPWEGVVAETDYANKKHRVKSLDWRDQPLHSPRNSILLASGDEKEIPHYISAKKNDYIEKHSCSFEYSVTGIKGRVIRWKEFGVTPNLQSLNERSHEYGRKIRVWYEIGNTGNRDITQYNVEFLIKIYYPVIGPIDAEVGLEIPRYIKSVSQSHSFQHTGHKLEAGKLLTTYTDFRLFDSSSYYTIKDVVFINHKYELTFPNCVVKYCPKCGVLSNMRISEAKDIDGNTKEEAIEKAYHCMICDSFVCSEIVNDPKNPR